MTQRNLLDNLPMLTALGCSLLPFVAVHITYLLAAQFGFVDWCIPYIDSCTSISATGRRAPASFVFRGLMLPSAMLMMLFWWLHWFWIGHWQGADEHRRKRHSMLALGWIACVGLVLYVTVLGEIGDVWRLQRKIGTILFFSFTFLAQLLLASMLENRSEAPQSGSDRSWRCGRRMLRVCQLMLAVGVLSVIIQLISDPYHDRIEDAIEWILALLLQLNFLLICLQWRGQQWHLVFQSTRQ